MSPSAASSDAKATAIHALLADLQSKSYEFFCPTPETQELSIQKRIRQVEPEPLRATSLQDIWGWSIATNDIHRWHSKTLVDELIAAGILIQDEKDDTILRPRIRVSSLYPDGRAPNYYVHSSWPTNEVDSVFFGPESYRYVRYMKRLLPRMTNPSIAVDMCTGAGVAAIQLARMYPSLKVYGLDINQAAVQMGTINAAHLTPGRDVTMKVSDGFKSVVQELRGRTDIVFINPPFIAGEDRTYCAGGAQGFELMMRLCEEAREVLKVGGELWGHMAAPITFDGRDSFREALGKLQGFEIAEYEVIDVDIFGNEMENPKAYHNVGRLASVGLVLRKVATDGTRTRRSAPRAPNV